MGHLKILFCGTTWPIFTKLGTNHSWVKWIQVCSNEGDSPSPKGDNSKRVKCNENFQKSFCPEPTGQIQSNLVHIILG
jgi:hypothetical protein